MDGDANGPLKRVTLEGGPVRVPEFVLRALEAVRDSGATNMLDRPRVIEIARAFGCDEAAAWIEAHRSDYANGIFRGFIAEPDGEAAQ
jgi:hypothetical protein